MARRAQRRTAGRGDDVEVWQWVAALRASGGDATAQRLMIVSRFVAAEKAAGTWALTDDYWALWAENEIQALTSLKQKRLATAVGAPAFTADRGYTFDGVASHVRTGFVPSTHSTTMTPSNMRIAVYERLDLSANSYTAGSTAATNQSLGIRTRSTASAFATVNSAAITYTLSVADSRGYTAFSRNGAGAAESAGYKNGVALTQGASTTFASSVLCSQDTYIGCQNSVGTATAFRPTGVGFLTVGAALSAAQEAAQYANIQAWATSIGANV